MTYDHATDEVVFVSTQSDNTWFGILLGGSTMTNTEAIYFVASGASSSVKNYYSTSHVTPTISADQSLFSKILSKTSTVKMTTRRKLNPKKTNQFVIPLD